MTQSKKFVTKTSKKQELFKTGMKRDSSDGKGGYELVSPIMMRRLSLLLERGAAHYGKRNWEKGSPQSRVIQSAIRHLFNLLEGDRTEDHATAAIFNCMVLVHQDEMFARGLLPKELDDLPNYIAPVKRTAKKKPAKKKPVK